MKNPKLIEIKNAAMPNPKLDDVDTSIMIQGNKESDPIRCMISIMFVKYQEKIT